MIISFILEMNIFPFSLNGHIGPPPQLCRLIKPITIDIISAHNSISFKHVLLWVLCLRATHNHDQLTIRETIELNMLTITILVSTNFSFSYFTNKYQFGSLGIIEN